MAVVDHVDVALLLSGASDELDASHARLIDGRAIFQYLLFIEPRLTSIVPSIDGDAVELDGTAVRQACTSRSLKEAAARLATQGAKLCRIPLSQRVAELSHAPEVFVVCSLANSCRETSDVSLAVAYSRGLALLERVGLGFFVELGLGTVMLHPDGSPLVAGQVGNLPFTALIDRTEPRASADVLIRRGAEEFLWQWLAVENSLDPNSSNLRDQEDLQELSQLFSYCVACELRRRLPDVFGDASRAALSESEALKERLPTMLNWLAGYASSPLSQELFACWYPGWKRRLFIFNSPFDFMSDLPSSATRMSKPRRNPGI